MNWIGWVAIGILGLNVLFFGTLCVVHLIDKRRDRHD